MDDSATILRRANLRDLGRFLMDGRICDGDPEESVLPQEELTEAGIRLILEDELRLALHNGGENLEARIRAVTEKSWETGKMTGFLEGVRAGARAVLALLGEGELRI